MIKNAVKGMTSKHARINRMNKIKQPTLVSLFWFIVFTSKFVCCPAPEVVANHEAEQE